MNRMPEAECLFGRGALDRSVPSPWSTCYYFLGVLSASITILQEGKLTSVISQLRDTRGEGNDEEPASGLLERAAVG